MRGNSLARILRRIADVVDKLDESELENFLSGFSHSGSLTTLDHQKSSPTKNKHGKIDPFQLEKTMSQLREMSTRAAGSEFLNKLDLSRKELEALAKIRNIHVTKDDNLARIKEKVIEVVIGARLSSRAIRGA